MFYEVLVTRFSVEPGITLIYYNCKVDWSSQVAMDVVE